MEPEKQRALLVEDDHDVCELVRIVLRSENYAVDFAHDGSTGLRTALDNNYDLIILDLMLPEIDGWEICKQLRENASTRGIPIIMLTAKGEEKDKVLGLEIGADDYVAKPFSPRELLARVKALLRRSTNYNRPLENLHRGNLTINPSRYEVTAHGENINLTPKEFELLLYLAHKSGTIIDREQLLEQVWGYDYFGAARTVDEHIKRIRQKIAAADRQYSYIQTAWGVGYKFEVKKHVE